MPTPPERLVLGLGCARDTAAETIRAAIAGALASIGARPEQVALAASIDLKADEPGLREAVAGWPLHFYSAAQLATVTVPNPSETVRRHTGTPSVSAAAALLAAAQPMHALLVERYRLRDAQGRHATVAIARLQTDPRDPLA